MLIKRSIVGGIFLGFFLWIMEIYIIFIQQENVFQRLIHEDPYLQPLYSIGIYILFGFILGSITAVAISIVKLTGRNIRLFSKCVTFIYPLIFSSITMMNLHYFWFSTFCDLSSIMKIASILYVIVLVILTWIFSNKCFYSASIILQNEKKYPNRNKFKKNIKIMSTLLFIIFIISSVYITPFKAEPVNKEENILKEKNKPSVIIILVDTLRADYLSCYGNPEINTTTIDSLAKNAILFQNAFTHAPWTRPAVATLFTGLYPSSHGVNMSSRMEGGDIGSILSEDTFTLAEFFKKKGYYTAGINANATITDKFAYDQGFDEYIFLDVPLLGKFTIFRWIEKCFNIYLKNSFYTNAKSLVDRTLKWLDTNKQKPFFLYLHFMDTHRPYIKKPDAFWIRTDSYYGKKMYHEMKDSYLNDYKSEISFVDQQLGRLFTKLKEKGLYDESLILFTADHGEEFLEHGGYDHGHTLYNELLSIPLLIKTPFAKKAKKDDRLIGLIDIFPTIVSYLGFELPQGLQGKVMLDYKGISINHKNYIFSERGPTGKGQRAIRMDEWKMIITHSLEDASYEEYELFNLTEDPQEQHNLSKMYKDTTTSLKNTILDIEEYALKNNIRTRQIAIDPSIKEKLKTLGYLD